MNQNKVEHAGKSARKCGSKRPIVVACLMLVLAVSGLLAYLHLWPLARNLVCYAGHRHPLVSKAPDATRILFIGNSLTYTENVPGVFAWMLAKARPAEHFDVESFTWPDSTLKQNSEREEVKKLLSKPWRYVILQEHSSAEFWGKARFQSSFASCLSLIRDAHVSPLIIMTWADRDRLNMQVLTSRLYRQTCRELHLSMVPVGDLFFYVQKTNPQIELYQKDGHHPGPAGSYLYALTLYAHLFGEDRLPENDQAYQSGAPLDPLLGKQLCKSLRKFRQYYWVFPAKSESVTPSRQGLTAGQK